MHPSISASLSQDTAAVAESLSAMMQKEQAVYQCDDYLHAPATLITESDRLKIVDWCYGVIDHCKFDRETVAIAMDMVDRFLSKPSSAAALVRRDRKQFQLLAVAALYIAIKTNERVSFGSDQFAALSGGIYATEDIEDMELIILEGLEWRVCAPTSAQMAHHILSLALPHVDLRESTWGLVLDEVRFQTEHAVRDYYFCLRRPSTVAMAGIFNTLDQLENEDRQAVLRALMFVMNHEFDHPQELMDARERLHLFIQGDVATAPEVSDEDESDMSDEDTYYGAHEDDSVVSEVDVSNVDTVVLELSSRSSESQASCLECLVEHKICTEVYSRTSPRTVATCCRRDNVLCRDCMRV
jgi:hypothetical protein